MSSSIVSLGYTSLPGTGTNHRAGSGTVGETAQPLDALATPVRRGVYVKAPASNSTNLLYVGPPGMELFPLAAGETSPLIEVDSLDAISVKGSTSGVGFSWWSL